MRKLTDFSKFKFLKASDRPDKNKWQALVAKMKNRESVIVDTQNQAISFQRAAQQLGFSAYRHFTMHGTYQVWICKPEEKK